MRKGLPVEKRSVSTLNSFKVLTHSHHGVVPVRLHLLENGRRRIQSVFMFLDTSSPISLRN